MKMTIPFFFLGGGGGGGGPGGDVRGNRNLGGSSATFKLSTTKDRPPLPEFLDPPLHGQYGSQCHPSFTWGGEEKSFMLEQRQESALRNVSPVIFQPLPLVTAEPRPLAIASYAAG